MAEEFKPGDVVVLRSGSPAMTVRWAGERMGELAVCCSWFVGTKLREETFAPDMLRKPPPRRNAIAVAFR